MVNKYKKNVFVLVIFVLVVFVLTIQWFIYLFNKPVKENFSDQLTNKTKAFYINLDKNNTRNLNLIESYNNSDLKEMLLSRFSAIVGKNVDLEQWLTPQAIIQVNQTEKTKKRTHHYQLTRGAVGCFLSHYFLAKQLLKESSEVEYYLIFEDDINFNQNILSEIKRYLSVAPSDWDIIHFSNTRKTNYSMEGDFFKPAGFWGMLSYILNKKGAEKIVKEVEANKIDGQIDAYLSRMIQQDKINIYIANKRLIYYINNGSDIQTPIYNTIDNPFNYKGYFV